MLCFRVAKCVREKIAGDLVAKLPLILAGVVYWPRVHRDPRIPRKKLWPYCKEAGSQLQLVEVGCDLSWLLFYAQFVMLYPDGDLVVWFVLFPIYCGLTVFVFHMKLWGVPRLLWMLETNELLILSGSGICLQHSRCQGAWFFFWWKESRMKNVCEKQNRNS